jgi:glycosyltransferase involved in cell wall biosynthesis
MFSIILTAYNCESWILKTIDSLLKQTNKSWECLIIENGSTDNTNNIIQQLKSNDKFKIFNLKTPNKSAALNYGILKSNFDWISILDSDDLWTEDKLQVQKLEIENNSKIDILGTRLRYIDENDNYISPYPVLPLTYDEIKLSFNLNNNAFANSSVVYKKNIHEQLGYYDTEINGVEDYDWWRRCIRNNFYGINLKNECLLHRIHVTSNFNSKKKKQADYKNLVDKISIFKENYE